MEILIGTACGLFMGTIFINVAALMVFYPRKGPSITASLLTRGPYPLSLTLLLPLIVMMGWGIVGGIMALLYLAAEELFPEDGLGSPNRVFTIAVSVFTFNVVALGLLWLRRRVWWEGYMLGLTFVGLFGWLMPWLVS